MHLNIRSLSSKSDQLRVILANNNLQVVTISETWLNSSHTDQNTHINGFTSFRSDRSYPSNGTKRGGGLITYMSPEFADNTVPMTKLNHCSINLEAQWLKVKRDRTSNLIICNLYRPPNGELSEAISYLNTCLNSLNVSKNDIFLLGDRNVNYKNILSPNYKKLSFFENSNGLKQIIKDTTRNTDESNTLIDLIMTNAKYISDSGTINSFISDHQPIFVIKKKQRQSSCRMEFEGRSYKNLDLNSYLDNIHKCQWNELYSCNDPEIAWRILFGKLSDELDKLCPVKVTKVKKYVPDWIDASLIDQIKDRDYFYA